ncbi:MAG TPA: ABC transporter permease [Chloroflexi bacterium]|nr:ABC transporter permease [Chloroflexota bacterium]
MLKKEQEIQQIVIDPEDRKRRLINWQEMWQYRDLFFFLVWRDIKTRYAQSILGVGWAIIQPVFSMIVFTIVFGNLAKVNSEGVPYAIFSYTALVPWTFFSTSLTSASTSLIGSKNLITKVYFPRLIIPISPVLGKMIDFGISFLILLGMMVWFGVKPTIWALMVPVFIILMMLTAAGVGMWLTALSIQYRDIRYGSNFFVQLLMYASPVIYATSIIPEKYQILYALNPMVGVIEGFRAALLGTRAMPWDLLGVGSLMAVAFFLSGALYFRAMERYFADVA